MILHFLLIVVSLVYLFVILHKNNNLKIKMLSSQWAKTAEKSEISSNKKKLALYYDILQFHSGINCEVTLYNTVLTLVNLN